MSITGLWLCVLLTVPLVTIQLHTLTTARPREHLIGHLAQIQANGPEYEVMVTCAWLVARFYYKHVLFSQCAPSLLQISALIAMLLSNTPTRNAHAQWASHQVYTSLMRPAQLCMCMSINDIPDRDGHVHSYIRTYIMRIDHSFRALH